MKRFCKRLHGLGWVSLRKATRNVPHARNPSQRDQARLLTYISSDRYFLSRDRPSPGACFDPLLPPRRRLCARLPLLLLASRILSVHSSSCCGCAELFLQALCSVSRQRRGVMAVTRLVCVSPSLSCSASTRFSVFSSLLFSFFFAGAPVHP